MRRQFGEVGFPVWRDLMHSLEPPLLAANLLGPGDPRTPCTLKEYDAALVDEWALFDRPHQWTDRLIVDQMAAAQNEGWEPCAGEEVNEAIEGILDDLAKRSGAKRAARQAEADALEAAERAQIDAELAAEFAIYEAWLAAGEPVTDPLADDHRRRQRRILQYQIDSEYNAITDWQNDQCAQNQISDDVESDAPEYIAYIAKDAGICVAYQAMLAAWEARHGGLDVIRRLFITDKRIPPGTNLLAMQRLQVLWRLPEDIQRLIGPVEHRGAVNMQTIPAEYKEAVYFAINALPFDRQSHMKSGSAIMAEPHLSVVPAVPAPDLIQSSGDFVRGFVPPDYLLDGVLQRRFVYSITAQTGVGKTAVAMLIAAHVATGRKLGNLDVEKGTVLYFAGENPTDIQMRWLGSTRSMGIDPETTDVHFVPGATPLSGIAQRIDAEVARKGLRPALVVVDTAAAYFEGDDENSNTQAVEHARRMRSLTNLPGGPTVIILCHPTKRAAADDLIPRGGGAFLNEVDGNIALRKQDTLIGAEVQGKFRGREFAPLHFELNTVYHPLLKDARGRDIPTVVAKAIDDSTKQRMADTSRRSEDLLLRVIFDQPGASLRTWASAMGWVDAKGQPQAMRVSRACEALAKVKMVEKHRDAWRCTPAGEKELNKLDQPSSQPVTAGVTSTPPFPTFPSP
jgi:hypothetical protein